MSVFNDILDDVSGRCAAARTLKTARAVTRHYDNALRPAGITVAQFTLMVVVAKTQPESISMIGDILSIERTSVSRNLALLEKRGLVERGDETMARKRPVVLTRKGRAKLNEAYALWQTAQSEIEMKFSSGGFSGAMKALRTLRQ